MSNTEHLNTIGNFQTAAVDTDSGKKLRRQAQNKAREHAPAYIGRPDDYVADTKRDEQRYKQHVVLLVNDVVIKGNKERLVKSPEDKIIYTNYGALVEAITNSPDAARTFKDIVAKAENDASVSAYTKIKNPRGEEIMLIPGSYRSMKSSILAALKRGEKDLAGMTKAELAEGKAAVKARSVVTADTLNAAKAKLDA